MMMRKDDNDSWLICFTCLTCTTFARVLMCETKKQKITALNTETVNFEVLIKFKFYGTLTKPADLINTNTRNF